MNASTAEPKALRPKRRVFISYHHANDQYFKDSLIQFNDQHQIFIDASVDTGDVDENLPSQTIREKIRDEYLANSTVTILLTGTETKYRKHVDWELYSSMFDGRMNKKSGIVVVTLPSASCGYFQAAHAGEKQIVYPECQSWSTVSERAEFERRFPYLPDRIIDNLLKPEAKISVTPWDKLTVNSLVFLIEAAYQAREACEYDLSRDMRRANFSPMLSI